MKRIYNLTKLNIKLLSKYFIILILQFLFMLFIFTEVLPKYRYVTKTYKTFNDSALLKSILYYNDVDAMNIDIMSEESIKNESLLKKLKSNLIKLEEICRDNINIISTSPNINRYFFDIKGGRYDANVIEKQVLDIYLKDKIEIISLNDKKENTIQAYIISNDITRKLFKIGEVYETEISNYYDYKTKNSTKVNMQIAGFISNDISNIINRSVYTDGVSSAGLLFEHELPSSMEVHIFFEYNEFLKSIDSIEKMSVNNQFSKIIYFNKDTTNYEINSFNEKILSLNIGNSNTAEQLLVNQKNNINYILTKSIDKIIISIIMIISTIVISTYINSKQIKKSNSIYKLNGAKNFEIFISNFLVNILPYFIVFLPYAIYSIFRNSKLYAKLSNDLHFSKVRLLLNLNEIMIISFVLISFIMLFTFFSNYKILKSIQIKKVGV